MSIIRIKHNAENPYVMINKKTLELETLSWEAKGLWAFLISKPDDWKVSVAHLSKNFPAGKDKVYRLIKELKKHGLCKEVEGRTKKGRFETTDYVIYESAPQTKAAKTPPTRCFQPFTENPVTENPVTENPPLLNNDNTNNDNIEVVESLVKVSQTQSKDCLPPIKKEVSKEAIELASYLKTKILEWKKVLSNTASIKSWAKDIELLIKKDGYGKNIIMEVIDWLSIQEPNRKGFSWRNQILSGKSLRKSFDRLHGEMVLDSGHKEKSKALKISKLYSLAKQFQVKNEFITIALDHYDVNIALETFLDSIESNKNLSGTERTADLVYRLKGGLK